MKRPSLRLVFLPFALLGSLALPCFFTVTEGIHLKGNPVDFGVPPRKYGYAYREGLEQEPSYRPGTNYWTELQWHGWERRQNIEELSLASFRKGRGQEAKGNYAGALATYRSMLRRGLGGVAENRERVELLSQVGPKTRGLPSLLKSIGSKATAPLPTVEAVAPVLRPFVAYHLADSLPTSEPGRVGEAYLRVARRYPGSTRAEPSLIMAARSILTPRREKPTQPELWTAHSALRTLIVDYPKSRFRANAFGWLARIDLLRARVPQAEANYERQLAAARTQHDRFSAFDSLAQVAALRKRRDLAAVAYLRKFAVSDTHPYEQVQFIEGRIGSFDGTDARRFSEALRRDPRILLAYLNYRIQFTKPSADLLRFGSDLPNFSNAIRPRIAIKLAEAAMLLERSSDAKRYLALARGRGLSEDDAALAQFLHGTFAMRAGRYRAALSAFRTVRSRYGKSYLVPGAMENLAILAEREGRLGDALDLYNRLGYRHDFAYMVDARMSPAQLEAYLHRRDAAHRPLITYTLGMRYLRLSRWNDAARTFAKLTTKQRRELTLVSEWVTNGGGNTQDPLATLKALRSLDRATQRARGSEAKAAAMYRMASYYYTHRSLLLYSPHLWEGARSMSFSYSWNADAAQPADRLALVRHHFEHECLAHALRICQEILRKYPKSAIAGHAAYRGSCAAWRLSSMSAYWRWVDETRDLSGESVRLMKRAMSDPELGRSARKYKGVFAEERREARAEVKWNRSLPERQWDPRRQLEEGGEE